MSHLQLAEERVENDDAVADEQYGDEGRKEWPNAEEMQNSHRLDCSKNGHPNHHRHQVVLVALKIQSGNLSYLNTNAFLTVFTALIHKHEMKAAPTQMRNKTTKMMIRTAQYNDKTKMILSNSEGVRLPPWLTEHISSNPPSLIAKYSNNSLQVAKLKAMMLTMQVVIANALTSRFRKPMTRTAGKWQNYILGNYWIIRKITSDVERHAAKEVVNLQHDDACKICKQGVSLC